MGLLIGGEELRLILLRQGLVEVAQVSTIELSLVHDDHVTLWSAPREVVQVLRLLI